MALVMTVCYIFAVDLTAVADDNRFGIDISEHNGDFDIAERKNKGENFIMIRLGYYNHLDKYFNENIKKAAEAEMNFGVYLYSYAYNSNEAKIEADFVIKTLESLPEEYLEHMTLPVAYDLEEPVIAQKCSKTQITKQMTIFCEAIRNAGYTPMVYANTDWFTNYIDIKTAVDNNYKLWYAYYPNKIPTKFTSLRKIGSTPYYADMWQYAVTQEVVGELDKNVMYSSMGCETHSYRTETKKIAATTSKAGRIWDAHICEECGYQYPSNIKNINPVKTFALSTTTYAYNGRTKTPAVTVKDSRGRTLKKNTDYTVTYQSGRTKIGKYKVTVKLKGNYSGTKYLYFTISPRISLSGTNYTYNGKVKTPAVTVKDGNGNRISTKYYTVAYASGRKNVGKYKVTIKFRNGHSGTYTKYFTIKPTATSISSVSPTKRAFTVRWRKRTAQVTGYQVQYSVKSNFSTYKTARITNNSTTLRKISKLASKRRYYVRVRTYKTVGKTNYYSAWSSKKSVVTK